MKAFEVDWGYARGLLPVWEALPLAARAAAVTYLRSSGDASGPALAEQMPVLAEAGVAVWEGRHARPAQAWRPMMRLLRAMSRAPVLGPQDEASLTRYLEEHFATDECHDLLSRQGYYQRQFLAQRAGSRGWLAGFLAASDRDALAGWEEERRSAQSVSPRLSIPATQRVSVQLVRALLERTEGAPLAELAQLLPDEPDRLLNAALDVGLRYLLLFADLDEVLRPRVGVWPPAARGLTAAPAPPPERTEVVQRFHAALTMEDMAAVLAAAATEPLRIRAADGRIFARARPGIASRMIQVPDWVALELETDSRIDSAAVLLETVGYATTGGRRGEEPHLQPTAAGRRWLGESARDRLKALLDKLRAGGAHRAYGSWLFVPGSFREERLRRQVTAAFASLPPGEFVSIPAFLDHAAAGDTPLLEPEPVYSYYHRTAEAAAQEWKRLLTRFLVERLFLLGGATLGVSADATFCFALEEPGQYLLGAADGFAYGELDAAALLVQPNFEIVFMAPAPLWEARLARFAQRVGSGVGVLFRLTREALQEAVGGGEPLDAVIACLEEASQHPLPANVARQLRDWGAQTRSVRLQRAVLIHCPDEATAAQLQAKLKMTVRRVSATLLEADAPDRKALSALAKQLRAAGVFVRE